MKTYSRADFFLDLSSLPQPDRQKERELADRCRQAACPVLLAASYARLAAWLAADPPDIRQRALFVFASDALVMEEGGLSVPGTLPVAEAIQRLAEGSHPSSRLAELTGARQVAVNLGLGEPVGGTVHLHLMADGARNILEEEAMTETTMMTGIRLGMELAVQAVEEGFSLLAADSLSEGAQVAATAVLSLLFDRPPQALMERGDDLPDPVFDRRSQVLEEAVARRAPNPFNTLDVLRALGNPEIAAMTGFFAGAALRGTPVLLGGTVSHLSALILDRLSRGIRSLFFAALPLPDPGGELAQRELGLTPLIDDRMRAGACGSALWLLPLLDLARGFHRPAQGGRSGDK